LLNALGNVYRQQGRNAEAFAAYSRALAVFQETCGISDPRSAAPPCRDWGHKWIAVEQGNERLREMEAHWLLGGREAQERETTNEREGAGRHSIERLLSFKRLAHWGEAR